MTLLADRVTVTLMTLTSSRTPVE